MFTLTVQETFSAAHILDSSYSEECQELHGHNWKVTLSVFSEKLNKDGMVVDFKLIKERFKRICASLDHKLIVPVSLVSYPVLPDEKDCFVFKIITKNMEIIVKEPSKVFVFSYNPTAEIIANFIAENIKWYLDVNVFEVSIEETENNKCTYIPNKGDKEG